MYRRRGDVASNLIFVLHVYPGIDAVKAHAPRHFAEFFHGALELLEKTFRSFW